MTVVSFTQILTPADLEQQISEKIAAQTASFTAQLQAVQAARAAAQMATKAAQPVVAQALFLQHLTAMQMHYTTGEGAIATSAASVNPGAGAIFNLSEHLYRLPQEFAFRPVIKLAAPTPAVHPVSVAAHASLAGGLAVDAMVQHIHADGLATIQQHAKDLVAAAQKAAATKMMTAAWAAEMNRLRDRDKGIARRKIEQMYADAGKLGAVHPEQRARILEATNYASHMFGGLFASIIIVGGTVEHEVANALHVVVSPVAGAVKAVAGWVPGAVSSVGKLLGSIF